MRKLILLSCLTLSVFAFSSFINPNASADIEAPNGATVIEIPYFNSGPLCNGEFLELTGTWQIISNVHPDGNGGFHVVDHWHIKASGIGTYGNEYKLNYSDNFVTNTGAGGLPFTGTNTSNFNIIGKGKAPNLKSWGVVHVTINANGDVTADVNWSAFTCK
ncbi:MAG: hypothetical protein HKN68_08420 [Saprospiraceae bacterium]|nr:hypothetical protein [Saprospiraceae bacterium]